MIPPGFCAQQAATGGGQTEELWDVLPGVAWSDVADFGNKFSSGVGVKFTYAVNATLIEVWVRDDCGGPLIGLPLYCQLWQGTTKLQEVLMPGLSGGEGTEHRLTGLSWALTAGTEYEVQVFVDTYTTYPQWFQRNDGIFAGGSGGQFSSVQGMTNKVNDASQPGGSDGGRCKYVNVVVEAP